MTDLFDDVMATLGDGHFVSDKPLSTRTYLIAMLPRTGSTALCSMLARSGAHGMPAEYLNPRGPLQYWAKTLGTSDALHYFDALRREQATPNGVFGLKSTYDDFAPLVDTGSATALLGDIRFVYLTRADILGQAISEYLAEESGVWHRDTAGRPLQSTPVKDSADVEFDQQKILFIVDRLVAMQQAWERFFVLYGIDPLRLTYESWCADVPGTLERFGAYIGVPWTGGATLDDAATSKLADDRAAAWAARIRQSFTL